MGEGEENTLGDVEDAINAAESVVEPTAAQAIGSASQSAVTALVDGYSIAVDVIVCKIRQCEE